MFKRFSRFLMIFTVAISLTGISGTENNAQACGGCGEPACTPVFESGGFGIGGDGIGPYEAWSLIIGNGVELLEQPQMFIASKIEVLEGCLVCRDSNNEEYEGGLPKDLSVEIYSPASDLQQTGTDNYEITQEVCSAACGACIGNVRQLELKYNGTASANIVVRQEKKVLNIVSKVILFDDKVTAEGKFSFTCLDPIRGVVSEIEILVDDESKPNATIDTSCPIPFGTGLVAGDFTVISGTSNGDGLLCPLDRGGCIQSEFENTWGLSSNDCTNNDWEPDQIRAIAVRLWGRILDDCSFCGDVDPYSCTQVDESCLVCIADKGCEASDWDEVTYSCSTSPVACD